MPSPGPQNACPTAGTLNAEPIEQGRWVVEKSGSFGQPYILASKSEFDMGVNERAETVDRLENEPTKKLPRARFFCQGDVNRRNRWKNVRQRGAGGRWEMRRGDKTG